MCKGVKTQKKTNEFFIIELGDIKVKLDELIEKYGLPKSRQKVIN